jgi:FPC/CPF motif-containing protein YcgG
MARTKRQQDRTKEILRKKISYVEECSNNKLAKYGVKKNE